MNRLVKRWQKAEERKARSNVVDTVKIDGEEFVFVETPRESSEPVDRETAPDGASKQGDL